MKWFKFIQSSPKSSITETPVQKPVHVAYSPIASMNYQRTIMSIMDIPLSKFCYQKSVFLPLFITSVSSSQPCITLVMTTFAPTTSYYPLKTMGEILAKVTRKVVEDIEKADGERVQNTATFLALAMGNWKRSYPITNLWTTWKLQPKRKMRPMMTYTSLEY